MRAEGIRRARATCSSRLVNAGRKTEQASDWVYRSLERPSGHRAVTSRSGICQARDARLSSTCLLPKKSRRSRSAILCSSRRPLGIRRCFVRRRTTERETEARRDAMVTVLSNSEQSADMPPRGGDLEGEAPQAACLYDV